MVARGELVILNDKYGVKVDEIISSGQKLRTGARASADQKTPEAQPQNLPRSKHGAASGKPEQVNKMAQATAENAQAGQQGRCWRNLTIPILKMKKDSSLIKEG